MVPDVTGTNQSAEHAVGDVDQNTRENSVAVGATEKEILRTKHMKGNLEGGFIYI